MHYVVVGICGFYDSGYLSSCVKSSGALTTFKLLLSKTPDAQSRPFIKGLLVGLCASSQKYDSTCAKFLKQPISSSFEIIWYPKEFFSCKD